MENKDNEIAFPETTTGLTGITLSGLKIVDDSNHEQPIKPKPVLQFINIKVDPFGMNEIPNPWFGINLWFKNIIYTYMYDDIKLICRYDIEIKQNQTIPFANIGTLTITAYDTDPRNLCKSNYLI